MVTQFYQILKAVVEITSPAFRTDVSAAPMTDMEMYALKDYCQMWSRMWGCVVPGMEITNRTRAQGEAHVD